AAAKSSIGVPPAGLNGASISRFPPKASARVGPVRSARIGQPSKAPPARCRPRVAGGDSLLYSRADPPGGRDCAAVIDVSLGPRGGVVTQRSAKPCTPVQFRAWPPLSDIRCGSTARAALARPGRARRARSSRRDSQGAAARPSHGRPVRTLLCYAAKYCCYAANINDSFGIPTYIEVESRLGGYANSMMMLALL